MYEGSKFAGAAAAGMVGIGAFGGAGAALAAAQSTRELGVLENAIHGTGGAITELTCALDNLERQMAQVLRPNPPMPTGDGKSLAQVNPITSPAVERLHGERRRIEVLIMRVNDLASRLEG